MARRENGTAKVLIEVGIYEHPILFFDDSHEPAFWKFSIYADD
jgi:hypothetical protein